METAVLCKICGLTQRMEDPRSGTVAECCRCGFTLAKPRTRSLHRTAALSLAALILYVPANLYPILRMESYGAYSESTVWDGCVKLFQSGQWFVAGVVFSASILIPLGKLLGLFFLVGTVNRRGLRWQRQRSWIYRAIEVLGPWAMLDVFLLAVLVALVKLNQIATVMPGPGIVAFTSVVILTMLASANFDPKLIWKTQEAR